MSLKEAVFKVQSEVTKVGKEGYNPHTKKNYATLESVLDALNEALQTHKLIVTQTTCFVDGQWALKTSVCLSDGKECESFDTPLLGLGAGNNPMQALGSAMTYARRYALINYFKLAASDDDGEEAGDAKLTVVQEKKPVKNHAPQKPKGFVVPEGKFKGMNVLEIPKEDLESYVSTMTEVVKDSGREEPKWFIELKKALEAK